MEIGERIFEALLKTGWDVDITDEGHVTAKRAGAEITGKIESGGALSWSSGNDVEKVLLEARILELRNRATQVHSSR